MNEKQTSSGRPVGKIKERTEVDDCSIKAETKLETRMLEQGIRRKYFYGDCSRKERCNWIFALCNNLVGQTGIVSSCSFSSLLSTCKYSLFNQLTCFDSFPL